MAISLETAAVEQSTYVVTVTFRDEDGSLVVPSAATWTLTDESGTTVINSRSAVSLAPLASSKTIVLSGDDLALTGDGLAVRLLTVEAIYTSSLGANLTLNEEIRFSVENLAAVG